MEYSKVQHGFARTAIFKGSDPASRGVWLSLHVYCGDQENGGVVRSCAAWNDRQWYAAIDASRAELDAAIAQGMARWEGNDLQLNNYDTVGEAAYQSTRELNRAKANKRWHKEAQPPVPRETIPPAVPPASNTYAGGNAAGDARAKPAAMPIPYHSIPVQATPPTPNAEPEAGAGADEIEAAQTKAYRLGELNKLLTKLIVASGPVATPRWGALAEQCHSRSLGEALDCIRWLVERTRKSGAVVEYASDVLPHIEAWKHHRADQRRQERERAARGRDISEITEGATT